MLFDGRRLEPDLVEGPFGMFSEDGFARLRFAAGACKIRDALFSPQMVPGFLSTFL